MTRQNDRDTQATSQGRLAGLDLVHATQQSISIEAQLVILDDATTLWAQLASRATSALVAEVVSTAYTAISHERTARTILSNVSLDVTSGILQQDLPKSIERYNETIMYVGFASAEWGETAYDLNEYFVKHADTLDQAAADLHRNLIIDALAQSNRLTALHYRLSQLRAHCYERLLYPPAAPESVEDVAQ